MSQMPPGGYPPAPGPTGMSPAPPPPGAWAPSGKLTLIRPTRWPMVMMFLITIVAVGAALAAWLRPIPHSAIASRPIYSEQQVADAKSSVCAAFDTAQNASRANLSRSGSDDPNAQLLIAVNMRQVFVASSAYLSTTLADEPAAPPELADSVRKLARLLQVITLDGLVGNPNNSGHDAVNAVAKTIEDQCK